MWGFDVGTFNPYIKSFCDKFDLTNLIKKTRRFKSPEIPSCIDLIFIIKPRSFQNPCAIVDIHCNENVFSEI